ncbi:MAG: arylsulfatase [Chloroflexota bacterium]
MKNSTAIPPNIILILADDMGFADIGCFGSEIETPNLDRLGMEGVRCTSMYNGARCCPTRASLLTGLYPHQAGVGFMIGDLGRSAYQGYLRDDCVTIAELLQTNGYRTLMAGKWHVGGDYEPRKADSWRPGDLSHPTPNQRGFDRFYGMLDGAGSFFHPHYVMEDGKRVETDPENYYLTDAITEKGIEMIEGAVEEERPFFLYLAHTAPHWPLHAHPEEIAKYEGRYRQGWDAVRTARHEEMKGLKLVDSRWDISPRDPDALPWEDVAEQDWYDLCMAVYAAQIDRMDQGIGKVLDKLDELGVADNTIVLFLSDNGGCAELLEEDGWARFYGGTLPSGGEIQLGNRPDLRPGTADTFMSYGVAWSNVSNAPFRFHKRWVHEGGISTPLLVRWPNKIAGGRIDHTPCHVIDLMATFLAACGVDYPKEFNGRSIQPLAGENLLPLWEGGEWKRERPLFWEHQGNCAVRFDNWKLVREFGGAWELYDMNTDRTELHNLVAKNRPMAEQLTRLYSEWAGQIGVVEWELLLPIFAGLYAGGELT